MIPIIAGIPEAGEDTSGGEKSITVPVVSTATACTSSAAAASSHLITRAKEHGQERKDDYEDTDVHQAIRLNEYLHEPAHTIAWIKVNEIVQHVVDGVGSAAGQLAETEVVDFFLLKLCLCLDVGLVKKLRQPSVRIARRLRVFD